MDITELTVHELIEKLDKKELTSEEIAKSYLDRIDEKEKDVQAFVNVTDREEVLKKAEEKKLTYISITDHDNCKAYQELKKRNIKNYYTGKIIPGIEIKCVYGGNLVEVLGYNIDTEKMQKWADEYYKDKSKAKLQKKYIDILYKKAQEMGLKIDKEEIEKFDPKREWASVRMFKAIRRHKENEKFFPKGTLETFDNFSKKYCANRKSKLYIDKTKDYPPIQEVIK